MKKLITIIVLILISAINVYGQKEGNIWYFGSQAGIDFNSGTAVALTNGALNTNEGCASICNSNGSLLFYTDGSKIWNKNHAFMNNGTGLLGSSTSTQSAIIVKKPGSQLLYFVFTVAPHSGANGLRYSIVDMSLHGGLGAVNSSKNILVSTPTCEKITAIKHQNGSDFWIVCRKWNSTEIHSFLLTNTGLSLTPVISNVGINLVGSNSFTIGYLTASKVGNRIASANDYLSNLELFDFDNTTGVLSNPMLFSGFNSYGVYGVQFSPNGNLLYVSEEAHSSSRIMQYNLLSGNQAAIHNSRITLGTSSSSGGALQLAPDGKIYHAIITSNYLGVVNEPDSLGLACNYVQNGFYLAGRKSRFGLPTFYSSITAQNVQITYNYTCKGDSTLFSASVDTSYTLLWNFGDPASGLNNTSFDSNPRHLFTNSGNFVVTLIANNGIYTDTITDSVSIINSPFTNLGEDTLLCAGSSIILNGYYPNASYLWHNGSTNSFFSPSHPDTFWVEVSNSCGSAVDSIIVKYDSIVNIELGMDTTLCVGDSIVLYAYSSSASFIWNDGLVNSSKTVYSSGLYWVVASNVCGNVSDSINVFFDSVPLVDLGNDTTICAGQTITLSIDSPYSYFLWNHDLKDSKLVVNGPGDYWFVANDKCGIVTDTINIGYKYPPTLNLGADRELCNGDTLLLNASTVNAIYQWQDNSNNATYEVSSSGVYWVKSTNECGTSFDEIKVNYISKPKVDLSADSILCYTRVLILDASYPGATYLWQDLSTEETFFVNYPGTYWVEASNKCGVDSDTVEVKYHECDCNLYMPNAFTPDSDFKNDKIAPMTSCDYTDYKFVIFNRFGELIFETTDPNKSWDGIYNGSPSPLGVYIYVLNYSFDKKIPKMEKGSIALIR